MEKNFYAGKVQHLTNESTMTLTNEKGQQRVRKMRSASVLQPNGIDTTLLIRFLFPGDVQGTGYLDCRPEAHVVRRSSDPRSARTVFERAREIWRERRADGANDILSEAA